MPWTPQLKDFQENYTPPQIAPTTAPVTYPSPDTPTEEVESAISKPIPTRSTNALLDIPKWQASAFTFEGDYFATPLASRPLEELLAIAYLKSVRRTVMGTGLSYLASFSGRHRCLAAGDKVLMADSTWKDIERVQFGDTVISPQRDGTNYTARVIATHRHYEQEVYDVFSPETGKRIYTCSKDHKIPLNSLTNYVEYTAEKIARMSETVYSFGTDGRIEIRCEEAKPQMVYGFTLDSPSHLFVTNDRMITLNSGKSVTACLWGHMWDHTFLKYFETRVVQSPQDFVRAMEIVIKDGTKGAAFIIDEAGATMASSDWYEKWIRALTKTLQICGMLKPMILFVAPSRDFIVSGMRKLIVAEHYLERHHTDYTNIKAYHVKYSSIKHDYYYKKPMVRMGGTTYQLKRILQHSPPEWFLDRYKQHTEPRKVDMMSAFSDIVKSSVANKDEDQEPDYETLIQDVFEKKEIFFGRTSRNGYPTIDQAALEIHFKLRPKFARYIKDRVERRMQESFEENKEKEAIQAGKLEVIRDAQERKVKFDRLANLRKMAATTDDDVLHQTQGEVIKEKEEPKKEKEKERLEEMDEELKDVLSGMS